MISLCVVGGGRWGENHIRTLYDMGNLVGIVDVNLERLESLKSIYTGIKGFSSLEEAISGGFDGYVIATPAKTHVELGRKLLEKGKNVLIEKPLALSSKDSETLIRMSEQYGGKLMVGHQLLFHPAIIKIKELIDKGVIGKIRYISTSRLNLGTVRQKEDVIWSFAPHDISLINYLTEQLPIETKVLGSSFLQPDILDMANVELTYPENVKAFITVSWLYPIKEQKIIIVGDKAMISFDDCSQEKSIFLHKKRIEMKGSCPESKNEGIEKIDYVYSQPLKNELEYFIQLISNSERMEYGRNGHEVIKLLEKITRDIKS